MTASKDWPTHLDFRDALGNTLVCFRDPDLTGGEVRKNKLGFPLGFTGGFASVYRIEKGGRQWAVRCFTSPLPPDAAERYAAISAHLQSAGLAYTVPFSYDPHGIRVEGNLYPQSKWSGSRRSSSTGTSTSWLPARTQPRSPLSYVNGSRCAPTWRRRNPHGDLQHGNVLVVPGGQLRLVDYDGMYVPGLDGRKATELGQPAYQHPARDRSLFDHGLDRYAALAIYTALAALAQVPTLWSRYNNEDNLLFTPDDHADPGRSQVFTELVGFSPPVNVLAAALAEAALGSPSSVPTIEVALARTTPPRLPSARPSDRVAEGRPGTAPWYREAAAAEAGGLSRASATWNADVRPVWCRPGSVIVRWTEQEPVFDNRTRQGFEVHRPLGRLFRRTEVTVERTEQVQVGTRPVNTDTLTTWAWVAHAWWESLSRRTLRTGSGSRRSSVGSSRIKRRGSKPSSPSRMQNPSLARAASAIAARRQLTVITRGRGSTLIPRHGDSLFYAVAVSPSGPLSPLGSDARP